MVVLFMGADVRVDDPVPSMAGPHLGAITGGTSVARGPGLRFVDPRGSTVKPKVAGFVHRQAWFQAPSKLVHDSDSVY